MGLRSFFLHQLAQPSGWFAPLTARFLNRVNASENEDCIDALRLQPDSRVLDIGFGGSASFSRLLRDCPDGRVAGVEVSGEMVARARSAWAKEVVQGRLEVVEGTAERLDFADDSFDRVMTVNTLYFWRDLNAGVSEVLRVLTPGGRFVASIVPPDRLHCLGFHRVGFRTQTPEFYARALENAGYCDVRTDTPRGDGSTAHVSGTKPAER